MTELHQKNTAPQALRMMPREMLQDTDNITLASVVTLVLGCVQVGKN